MPSPPAPPALRSPLSRGLIWASRGFFVAAALAAVYGRWLRSAPHDEPIPPPSSNPKPVTIDWAKEPFQHWTSAEDGIAVDYPARFDAVRGFGRFTARDLTGGLTETDVVAFRSSTPRAVIVIALYHSQRHRTRGEWQSLIRQQVPVPADPKSKAPAPFAAEFGGSDQQYQTIRVAGREGLEVRARGAVKYPLRGNETMELWDLISRTFADGDRAIRITAGVHHAQFEGSRSGLERTLASFRWNPPEEPTHRSGGS